jgi:hypothetical protein
MKASKTLDRMRELGIEPATPELMTARGFGEFVRKEYESSREAVRLAGLKKE